MAAAPLPIIYPPAASDSVLNPVLAEHQFLSSSRRAYSSVLGVAVCAGLAVLAIGTVRLADISHFSLFLFFCVLALLAVLLPATGPRGQRVGLIPAVGLAAMLLLPPVLAVLPLLLANTAFAFSRELVPARRAVYERGGWLLLATLVGGVLHGFLLAHSPKPDMLLADIVAALVYGLLYVLGRFFRLTGQFGSQRTVRRHAYRHWRLEAVTVCVTAPLTVLMAQSFHAQGLIGLCGTTLLPALMLVVAHFGFEVAALQEQVRAMEKISAVTVSQTSAGKVMERFLSLSGGLVSSDRVVLWLTDESQTRLERMGGPRTVSAETSTASVRFGEGLVGRVAQRKKPLLVRDGAHDPRRIPEEQERTEQACAGAAFSMLLLPLVAGDEAMGVVQFERDAPGAFAARDLARIQALGTQAAATLANVRAHQAVYSQAVTDALTGLFNRRQMQTVLADERRRAHRYGHPLSVIMLDVDGFKGYNDTYGHVQGDVLLKMMAAVLQGSVRGVDTVGRFGGEEFIIIMPETTSMEAYQTAERLRLAVAHTVFPGFANDPDLAIFKTISLGVATFPDITQDTQALVTLADNALYRAKRNGRNQTVQADADTLTLERE